MEMSILMKFFFSLMKNNYKADFILQAARGENDIQTAKSQLAFVKHIYLNIFDEFKFIQ